MAMWRTVGLAFVAAFVASSASAQETRLLLNSFNPAGSPSSAFFNAWAQRVNGQSQGTLRVEVRDGATLANFANVYDRTMDDVVQIGWAQHAFVAGRFPLSEITNLPFMADDNVTCSVALWRLYKTGLLDAEYKDVVPIWFGCLGQTDIHFAKPTRSNDDLGGLKIRVAGKSSSQLIERLGGTPISMGADGMYEALQRGTIDGAVTSWAAFAPYRLAEVASYHLEVPIGYPPSMFFMSRKKFDALPAAARKAIEDNGGEAQTRAFGAEIERQAAVARAQSSGSDKHKIVVLTPDQIKSWETRVAVVRDDWAKERAGGDKAVEAYRAIYAKAKAER